MSESEQESTQKRETEAKINKWKNELFVFLFSWIYSFVNTRTQHTQKLQIAFCNEMWWLTGIGTMHHQLFYIWSAYKFIYHASVARRERERAWMKRKKRWTKNQNTKEMLKMRQTRVSLKMFVSVCVCVFYSFLCSQVMLWFNFVLSVSCLFHLFLHMFLHTRTWFFLFCCWRYISNSDFM